MVNGYALTKNAALERRNTFRVPARAAWLAEIHDPGAIPETLARPEVKSLPLLVLGEGSNVLFTRDFAGVVLVMANRGTEVLEDDGETAHVRAAAGED